LDEYWVCSEVMEYQHVPQSALRRLLIQSALCVIAALVLLAPTKAAAAPEEPPVVEVATEAVQVVAEPEPEAAPVEPSPAASEEASSEAEVPVPEEAGAPAEAPATEEATSPAPPSSESQPQPEPQSESAPAEATDTEAADVAALASKPVKAATDLVTKTGERVASAGEEAAPVSAAADAVGSPADLGAGIERTLATVVDPLEGLTLLEALNPGNSNGLEGLVHAEARTGPTAGSTGSMPLPAELPSAVAPLPERLLPAAIDGPQLTQAPTGIVVPAPLAFADQGARGVSQASLPASSPSLSVLLSGGDEVQAGAARAASAGGLAGPTSLALPQSGHLGVGSGAGGSTIFIPLLGVLALLALAAPRGYRRRRAVRDFPVPTPFVCALERPG
jgi:hypothetical protein